MKLKTLASIGCLGVVLAACGGGGGGGDLGTVPDVGGGTNGPTTNVTASPFASVDAFIAYVRGLVSDETSEPVALPTEAAPTSDTTEPAA